MRKKDIVESLFPLILSHEPSRQSRIEGYVGSQRGKPLTPSFPPFVRQNAPSGTKDTKDTEVPIGGKNSPIPATAYQALAECGTFRQTIQTIKPKQPSPNK